MQRSIYGFIFKYSLPQQIVLVVLTFMSFPFIYLQAELPKRIVNDAISAPPGVFPIEIQGFQFNQISYLFFLCGSFLILVLINGGFKYFLNVFRGRLGERMLRRLRFELYSRVLRFPLAHFRRVSQGEIIPMITQEVEPLGGFIGDAIALPLYQAGILVTLLIFILMQDPLLGIAAVAFFPVQAVIVPILQRRVNMLAKERVRNVRRLSDHLGESISGISEIRANDNANFQRARFAQRLGIIYQIRYRIFLRKFFIKFFNNFLAHFTPFLFYSVGGYLAIQGELSVGALIAVISAHKDMNAPWKELLSHYQQREDARIKYEQVVEQFDPRGLIDEELQAKTEITPFRPDDIVAFRGVALSDDDGTVYLQHTSLDFRLDEKIAITGASGGGKEEFAPLLARLYQPTSGRILIGEEDLAMLPEAKVGRRFGYVSANPYMFSGSVRDNILLALRHVPDINADEDSRAWVIEARRAGNPPDDPEADWVDYASVGVSDPSELSDVIRQALHEVSLANDIYEFGLRGRLSVNASEELHHRFLEARRALRQRLEEGDLAGLVEPFDPARFILNATVAENMIFGTIVGETFNPDLLAGHEYVRSVLDQAGLSDDFLSIGQQVAQIMVDLFADFEASYSLMEQYSFISAEDLPEFQAILSRIGRGTGHEMAESDRVQLLSLPFRLAPERHRLGLIDEDMQSRILHARRLFARDLPSDLEGAVAFFDPEKLNPASSIQDNLLFGKIAYRRPQAENQVRAIVSETLRELDLIEAVIDIGLDFSVGVGGGRLSSVQRQKLAIARALVKKPDLLILNNPFGTFDEALRLSLIDQILRAQEGRGVAAVVDRSAATDRFDRIFIAQEGRIVPADDLPSTTPKNGRTEGSGIPCR